MRTVSGLSAVLRATSVGYLSQFPFATPPWGPSDAWSTSLERQTCRLTWDVPRGAGVGPLQQDEQYVPHLRGSNRGSDVTRLPPDLHSRDGAPPTTHDDPVAGEEVVRSDRGVDIADPLVVDVGPTFEDGASCRGFAGGDA